MKKVNDRGARRKDSVHAARTLLARRRSRLRHLRARPADFLSCRRRSGSRFISEHDQQIRHIYMNVPHSKNLKPSWYGESVGHYEGDTLVVDTIGLNDKTFVDNYRTPHTTSAACRGAIQAGRRRQDLGGTDRDRGSRRLHMKWRRCSAGRAARTARSSN